MGFIANTNMVKNDIKRINDIKIATELEEKKLELSINEPVKLESTGKTVESNKSPRIEG